MNHPIIILMVLAVALYLVYSFSRWKSGKPQAVIQQKITRFVIYLGIALLIFLALTGRLHWLFALLASALGALIPLLRRGLPFLIRYLPFLAGLYRQRQAQRTTASPSTGQQSRVETAYVFMTLDHDTGRMDGEIRQGDHRGKHLSELSQAELIGILQQCQEEDVDAVSLLEAYLDREHGPEWRKQQSYESSENNTREDTRTTMSQREAYEILGLNSDATEQQIIEAHRRLMQKLHPDRGGSSYLAAKINRAKDFLLKK